MKRFILAVISIFCFLQTVRADEGMWLFSSLPYKALEQKYGFQPDWDFITHLQKSSIRFSNGGSGSFISPNGLVMTNHHVALSFVAKLSTDGSDYLKDGFYAQTPEAELKCADIELVQLESIEDVTERVLKAEGAGATTEEKLVSRRKEIARIEEESKTKTGLFSEVTAFYQGGAYHLYRYKKFNDVRLVFAPEESVGYFGGEPDNFEYPRYNLDVAFFRVYENGVPYHPEHWLKWSDQGATDGELVMVSGHPGRTDRLYTLSHLIYQRDCYYPFFLENIRRQELTGMLFSERGQEEALIASSEYFRIRNTRKNRCGVLLGLQTPEILNTKRQEEEALRAKWAQRYPNDKNDPWQQIDRALSKMRDYYVLYELLENGEAFRSTYFDAARNLVRYASESEVPDAERLPEFRSSILFSVRNSIITATPIHSEWELEKLTDSLGFLQEKLGETELTKKIFAGLSPRQLAYQLVSRTQMGDTEYRKSLLDGGLPAVKNSTDPMIQLAQLVDAPSREIRKRVENEVNEPIKTAYARIAQFRFQTEDCYPDATFTLRFSYGRVAGYTEADGTVCPPFTTMAGAFDRAQQHNCQAPYALSQKWFDHQQEINGETPMNLVTTNDIVGGNSGSPLVNRRGEVVGLIFDGNIESLTSNFIYTEKVSRAVAVHSSAIREALMKIYHTDRLAQEAGWIQ